MNDNILREELLAVLDGNGAHMPFDEAVADFPDDAINRRPPNVPYTPWQLLEHLRITQADILDYIRNRAYVEIDWPADYWPANETTATPEQFTQTIESFRADLATLRALAADPATDLFATIPNSPGHTLLRELRIVGDHNAYHLGEFAILRQVMGTWPDARASVARDRAQEILVVGAAALAHVDDLASSLNALLAAIADAFEVASAAVVIEDRGGAGLEIAATFGLDAAATGLAEAIRRPSHPIARTFAAPEATFSVEPSGSGGPALRSHLPLVVTRDGVDRVLGVLALAHDRPLDSAAQPILLATADLAAVAIERLG